MTEQGVRACFKAYDIRGRVPDELDAELSAALGLALAAEFPLSRVVLGRDTRFSGLELGAALADGLRGAGVEVTEIGLCGTEEIYHAAASKGFDLGIMLTASHNPAEYNGIKIVLKGALPLSGDTGLFRLRDRILRRDFKIHPNNAGRARGGLRQESFRGEYLDFLRGNFRHLGALGGARPLKLLMNAGNGSAGPVLEDLMPQIPVEWVLIQGEPDGTFPNGVPNPLLPEKRADTSRAVQEKGADLGLAWDGDFDRCFFYDGRGEFVESYYLLGLLAQDALARAGGKGKILHDTRLFWNTVELVRAAGGTPVQYKTGHAFMKEKMRLENALYGGEMSAHHYFRDFYFCDSGMLPWLRLLDILLDLAESGQEGGLAELVAARIAAYPCSGEINFKVAGAQAVAEAVRMAFAGEIQAEDHLDGLSADCGNWRFNLRSSNTEPLLRLNVEARGKRDLMLEKTSAIAGVIKRNGGENA
ncbi:phosphomannomutase [Desulfovibrio sp. OttesenSCG-928-C14]|nr:phosphomannomutase [Desulfovibrio sp. OttesenSCG-928-C14]